MGRGRPPGALLDRREGDRARRRVRRHRRRHHGAGPRQDPSRRHGEPLTTGLSTSALPTADLPARRSAEEFRGALRPVLAAGRPLLIVSDFDGTLAPIAAPSVAFGVGARIDPLARRSLRRIAGIATAEGGIVVAVSSGRAVGDLASRVRVGGVRYLGNHGLETGTLARFGRAERLRMDREGGYARHTAAAAVLTRSVAEALGRPSWLFLEEKGPSVAFHWRGAPDEDDAARQVERAVEATLAASATDAGAGTGAVAAEPLFELLHGRRILELRPAGAGGKGHAVARLVAQVRPAGVIVLGDDRSDAAAFTEIAAARDEGAVRAALAIAVHAGDEAPPEVAAAADLVLASPHEAARLLAILASDLERDAGRGRPVARRAPSPRP
jgi:trehalose 6-phosphate phosphatase